MPQPLLVQSWNESEPVSVASESENAAVSWGVEFVREATALSAGTLGGVVSNLKLLAADQPDRLPAESWALVRQKYVVPLTRAKLGVQLALAPFAMPLEDEPDWSTVLQALSLQSWKDNVPVSEASGSENVVELRRRVDARCNAAECRHGREAVRRRRCMSFVTPSYM